MVFCANLSGCQPPSGTTLGILLHVTMARLLAIYATPDKQKVTWFGVRRAGGAEADLDASLEPLLPLPHPGLLPALGLAGGPILRLRRGRRGGERPSFCVTAPDKPDRTISTIFLKSPATKL
jgi:hypothetical protein